jgi:hypothetical protein
VRRLIRVIALMAFCAISWGAGTALVAAPAHASQCLPNGSSCPPDDFTFTAPGTLLASISGPITASGSFSGNYIEAVYLQNNTFCSSCLTFDLQISNQAGSAEAIQHVGVSNFQGSLTDLGYRSDGSTLGASWVDGSQIPTDVTRSTAGVKDTWDFTGTNSANLLPPGTTSTVLVVETNATEFTAGTVSAQDGGVAQVAGFQPVVTTMSTTANPSSGPIGSTLQDSATLMNTNSLDGTGSITFNLYGPGDTSCASVIHSETVTGISSNGPFSTTTGYVASAAGTYNWTASFSGDSNNASGSTRCGAEPVVIAANSPISQITPTSVTCSQFAGGTAQTFSQVTYSVSHAKIANATPGGFEYWAKVTSNGGSQTFAVTQHPNETTRPFLLASGSSAHAASCAKVSSTITQSGDTVTVTFNGGTAGSTIYIGLKFSTAHVVGEPSPKPSPTVHYLFKTSSSTRQLDLVK